MEKLVAAIAEVEGLADALQQTRAEARALTSCSVSWCLAVLSAMLRQKRTRRLLLFCSATCSAGVYGAFAY